MTVIRVLLVDDQALIREGLRKLLEVEEDVEVVGEAADGETALALVPVCRPHVALIDARMPGMSGVELIVRLAAEHSEVASLVLSTFDEDEYVFGALRAGARGYLLKGASPEELITAIHQAYRGLAVLDGPVARRVVEELRRLPAPRADLPGRELLSAREIEVARLIAIGATNREIATRLRITEGTVKNHVSSMLRKLGLRDRTQLALYLTGS
ncbi:response regulator [Thermostaphylospora chromogena]|uniref:DNA-binding response regulator, NarL/FixJ family, contains REC and HTH domains n=1 Tax=Thermostaphylospora chromogena TaxID=35622 RepID=A0A1H1I2X1_9ACTN|nr:response regulator transcription factor [Thermostaphylospora chromogena]SDR32010.1 DNA-binding response regulator, NarL/FixJ family, contains REC and HTH domains [Thermostaphylospora chromogena]